MRITVFSCGILGLAWGVWGQSFSAEDYNRLYYSYYQNPQPEKLQTALQYFVETAAETLPAPAPPLHSGARFFAVLASRDSRVWRYAESLFPGRPQNQQDVILEIFKRSRDEEATQFLLDWMRTETSDDRCLELEYIARLQSQPLDVLNQIPQDAQTLDEQWACFFAAGNTAVVQSSMELLANTTTSQSPLPTLHPFTSRLLRTQAWELLAIRACHYPAIRTALQNQAALTESQEGKKLLAAMAEQALELCDRAWAQRLMPLVLAAYSNQPFARYFQGAINVLEKPGQPLSGEVNTLERQEWIWAERLRGYAAYVKHLQIESDWVMSKTPENNPAVLSECRQALEQLMAFRSMEIWKAQMISGEETLSHFVRQTYTAIDPESRRLCVEVQSPRINAWWIDGEQLYWRTPEQIEWVEIYDQTSSGRIQALTDTKELMHLLADIQPVEINKIVSPEAEQVICAHYQGDLPLTALTQTLTQIYPDCSFRLRKASLWLDLERRVPWRLQVDMEIIPADSKSIPLSINRIFYDWNKVGIKTFIPAEASHR